MVKTLLVQKADAMAHVVRTTFAVTHCIRRKFALTFCVCKCHETGATGSLVPVPVPISPLSPCGSSSFPLPQPWSSSVLRRLDRSRPYRAGSDISPTCSPLASLDLLSFVSAMLPMRRSYLCCFLLIMLARPFSCLLTYAVSL